MKLFGASTFKSTGTDIVETASKGICVNIMGRVIPIITDHKKKSVGVEHMDR